MRSSRADERSGRESVFTRPAHLDDLVARVQSGESFADDGGHWDEDEGDGRYDGGGRYGAVRSARYSDPSGSPGRKRSSGAASAIEDMGREIEVLRMQNNNLERQLKGAVTELELHKRHCTEFKTMLQLTEGDLAAAHENHAHATDRLQTAQEASRRNSEMAQQVVVWLYVALPSEIGLPHASRGMVACVVAPSLSSRAAQSCSWVLLHASHASQS